MAFHATLLKVAQQCDETPMIWSVLCWCVRPLRVTICAVPLQPRESIGRQPTPAVWSFSVLTPMSLCTGSTCSTNRTGQKLTRFTPANHPYLGSCGLRTTAAPMRPRPTTARCSGSSTRFWFNRSAHKSCVEEPESRGDRTEASTWQLHPYLLHSAQSYHRNLGLWRRIRGAACCLRADTPVTPLSTASRLRRILDELCENSSVQIAPRWYVRLCCS